MKGLKRALQKGFSTMQVVAGLAIAAVVTAGAAAVMIPAYNNMIMDSAFEEITILAAAVRSMKQYEGGYTNLSFANLRSKGYVTDPPYTLATGPNRFGLNISADNTGAFTYVFENEEQCKNAIERVKGVIVGLSSTAPTCSTASLKVTMR